MIWLRRALAVPLIVIFVLIFIFGLVLCNLSGTVGSAGFYNRQMQKADVYNWTYDTLMPAILDETGMESPTGFPIDTPALKADMVAAIKQAFPPDWLQATFENATAHIFPYVTGDKDSLLVEVRLRERVGPMADGIKGVADNHKQEIGDYLTDELVVPAVTESLGDSTTLSYGVALTDDEVSEVIKTAMLDNDWAVMQFKSLVDMIARYLRGGATTLDLTIDLASVKSSAAAALSTLADEKLETAYNALPTCPLVQFEDQMATLAPGTLPSCRPDVYSYSYEQFKSALQTKLGMTISDAVDDAVMNSVDDTWQFNDAEMREALGEDAADTLDDLRDFIVNDKASITEQDVRDMLVDSDDTGTGSDSSRQLEDFDRVRHTIHTVKILLWVLWIVAILLLVGIGFLCGRNWKSRLLWPLCVLLVTSLLFVIVVAVAGTFVPDEIVPAPEGSDVTQVETVMNAKGDEIAHNAISTFVWELELKLIICIVVATLGIAAVIAWMIVDRRRHQESIQHDPSSPPP